MRASTHVLIFRLLVLSAVAANGIHCTDGSDDEPGCGGCDCLDRPDDDDTSDDDDSGGIGGDDDDATSDDDDDATSDDDDDTSETDVTLGLPACEGSILAAFTDDEIDAPSAASDGYQVPGEDTLEAIAASVDALLSGEPDLAVAEVAVVGYEVCAGEDDEAGTALWRPMIAGSGRAIFAWRSVGARPLIVGVPHPNFDIRTLQEGVDLFDRLDARVLVASGTHRCANTAESPCDGTTGVCGGDGLPFRESDMAHVSDSVYQVAHELFSDLYDDAWVISVHGMAADGISLSDGTSDPTDGDSPVARLGAALMAAFPDEDVTSCNDWPGAVVDARLCGTTNVQGRYINGSAEPCGEAPSAAAGRFLHLEQSTDVRDQADLVIDALDGVLP